MSSFGGKSYIWFTGLTNSKLIFDDGKIFHKRTSMKFSYSYYLKYKKTFDMFVKMEKIQHTIGDLKLANLPMDRKWVAWTPEKLVEIKIN